MPDQKPTLEYGKADLRPRGVLPIVIEIAKWVLFAYLAAEAVIVLFWAMGFVR